MEDDLLDEEELALLQSILNPEVEKSALEKMQLGSGNECAKCGKVVGHAEEVRKVNKVYHKHCYTCKNCESRLAKGDELEHEGDWYCKLSAMSNTMRFKDKCQLPPANITYFSSRLELLQKALCNKDLWVWHV